MFAWYSAHGCNHIDTQEFCEQTIWPGLRLAMPTAYFGAGVAGVHRNGHVLLDILLSPHVVSSGSTNFNHARGVFKRLPYVQPQHPQGFLDDDVHTGLRRIRRCTAACMYIRVYWQAVEQSIMYLFAFS